MSKTAQRRKQDFKLGYDDATKLIPKRKNRGSAYNAGYRDGKRFVAQVMDDLVDRLPKKVLTKVAEG